jgi:phosphoribosylanthranilate isomerase
MRAPRQFSEPRETSGRLPRFFVGLVMRVKAKICGITRAVDARAAVDAGCDALGFNFHPRSPRYVAPECAKEIIATVPPFVTCIGLFVDIAPDEGRRIAVDVGVTLLQFHGDESDEACAAAGFPFIKAINVSNDANLETLVARYPRASALLLDAAAPGLHGGSGTTFDWSRWPRAAGKPLVLAGGLTPDNVAEAIARTHPYAVDVTSGVEGDTKGHKDPRKLTAFMQEVRRAQ